MSGPRPSRSDPEKHETHCPIDASVAELEREEIPFDSSHLEDELLADMANKSLDYMRLHYPELTFARWAATGKPKGHEYAVSQPGHPKVWTVADWRTK